MHLVLQYSLVVVNYSSLDTISPHKVVGLFLSRVRLPGTASATNLRATAVNCEQFQTVTENSFVC